MAAPGPSNQLARRAINELMEFSGETQVPKYMKFFIEQQIAETKNFINVTREQAHSSRNRLAQLMMRYFSFGRHLDELRMTWAHLEKKRTRLRTNTKTLKDLCSQSLETTSYAILDVVATHQGTVSHISRNRQLAPTQM
ncbi:hypothetical protein Tco_1542513 [Tanacetum coccineum]